MQCPDGCSCFHDAAWDTNIIQCGLRGHTDVPLLIPMDATEIRLDGNNLTDVDSQSFIGRKRVTSLYLNNSQVNIILQYIDIRLVRSLLDWFEPVYGPFG